MLLVESQLLRFHINKRLKKTSTVLVHAHVHTLWTHQEPKIQFWYHDLVNLLDPLAIKEQCETFHVVEVHQVST